MSFSFFSSNKLTSCESRIPAFLSPRVLSILIMEAAERFAYYGFRAVLVLYFVNHLHYSKTVAISLYAYTSFFAYFTPLIGAVIADVYLGLYRTILVFGVFYVVGLFVLTNAAYLPEHNKNSQYISFIGLFLIGIGTGGIKPCVSAFGAEQIQDAYEKGEKKDEEEDHVTEQESETITTTNAVVIGAIKNSSSDVLVQQFYSWFYFCINLGSVLSFAIIPSIRAHFGYGAAFLVPSVFIVFAMLCFLSKRNEYSITKPIPVISPSTQQNSSVPNNHGLNQDVSSSHVTPSLLSTFQILFILIKAQCAEAMKRGCCKNPNRNTSSNPSRHEYGVLTYSMSDNQTTDSTTIHLQTNYSSQQIEDAKAILRIIPVFIFLPLFWMLYDQNSSVWTLQATHLNLYFLQAEQLGILNPILIMIFIPFFDGIVYPYAVRKGWNTSHLRRMVVGMFLLAVAFFASAMLQRAIHKTEEEDRTKISVLWIVPQYVLLSVAEILVSVTSLEFAYSYAPSSMKALIMAMNLVTVSVGDLLAGVLYTVLKDLNIAFLLDLCAVLMLGNLFLFHRLVVVRWDDWFPSPSVVAASRVILQPLAEDGDLITVR